MKEQPVPNVREDPLPSDAHKTAPFPVESVTLSTMRVFKVRVAPDSSVTRELSREVVASSLDGLMPIEVRVREPDETEKRLHVKGVAVMVRATEEKEVVAPLMENMTAPESRLPISLV